MRLIPTAATIAIALATLFCIAAVGQSHPIDPHASRLTIHASKAGLFSAFGDNHEVEAPISEGFVDEAGRRVQFTIRSRDLKVLDPQLSADKRAEVQQRMLGPDVLNVDQFPQITFHADSAEPGGREFMVRGQLTLHGVTREVPVRVAADNGRYSGKVTIKQKDFGITPVSVGGGTVKVKNELVIEFDVRTTSANSTQPK